MNNQQPKRGLNRKDFIFIGLVLLVVVGVILTFATAGAAKTISYNDFLAYRNANKIELIKATESSVTDQYIIEFTVSGDSQKYEVILSVDQYNSTTELIDNGALSAELTNKIPSTFDWVSLIFYVGIPIIMIIILINIFRRSANAQNNQAFDFARSRASVLLSLFPYTTSQSVHQLRGSCKSLRLLLPVL